MSKTEIYKAIRKIEDKYGLMCFRCSLSHLLSCGQQALQDEEEITKVKEKIQRTTPDNALMTADFQCDIVDCAVELSKFNSYDLFRYIKTDVSIDDWKEQWEADDEV